MTNPYIDRACRNCGEPIEEDQFIVRTIYQDHFPNEPHIRPEPIGVETYKCPECGYCPVDDADDDAPSEKDGS